jgi:hypothetical protein
MSFLSALPFPVRIVLFVLAGVLLFKVLGKIDNLLVGLSIALWVVVVVGLLYASGYLNALSRVPILAGGLGALTGTRLAHGSAGARPTAPAASSSASPATERALSDEERRRLSERATGTFSEVLVGVDDAIATIDESLLDVARSAQQRGEAGFGFGTTAPALVIILAGPHGVGKTVAATAIAELYVGAGILKTEKIVALRERDVDSGFGRTDTRTVLKLAESAVDGTLLVDNADWLVGADSAAEAGLAILEVAQTNPQRLLVILTTSDAVERKLRNDSRHGRWLNKLTVRTITFKPLDEPTLFELLKRNLDSRQLRLDDMAEKPAVGLIREMRDAMGTDFDNAVACRRLADDLAAVALSGGPDDTDPGIVTREDVRQVQEQG